MHIIRLSVKSNIPVTLGKTLDKVQMQKAFAVMQDSFTPFLAEVVEIGKSEST